LHIAIIVGDWQFQTPLTAGEVEFMAEKGTSQVPSLVANVPRARAFLTTQNHKSGKTKAAIL
jgi:hypothetical protein